jgi:hypothetical protein
MGSETNTTSLTDVISGKAPLKFEVAVDMKTVIILVSGIFLAVVLGVIIARKATN